MRFARKIYISIFTTLFILITCVATTFAWVGILTTATLGGFDLNIKTVDVDADYFLKISTKDEVLASSFNGSSFSDSTDTIQVKRKILFNMGYDTTQYLDEAIDQLFELKAVMEPVTTNSNLDGFYSIYDLKSGKPFLRKDNRYFKFDIYLSIDTNEGIATLNETELNALNINANVFFENIKTAILGTENSDSLINENPFSTIPSNSEFSCLKNINSKRITVNSKNATRMAFQIYEPKEISSLYDGTEVPVNTIIYQGGKQLPSVTDNVYDLGGILPEEYNLALKELNKIYDINVDLDTLYVDMNEDQVIQDAEKVNYTGAKDRYINNTDKEMIDANNKVWTAPTTISGTNYLGVKNGIQTKMKISVYFWYEGYDADCLRLVDYKPTSLQISLSTDKNNI